jgi:hypothetical protein
MGLQDTFLKLFDNRKILQLLAILSIAGIIVSAYPFYESVHNNTKRKIELIKEWQGIKNAKELPTTTTNAIYEQLVKDLESDERKVEAAIASQTKKISKQSCENYVWKFVAGGWLYGIVYFPVLLFCWFFMPYKAVFKNNWPVFVIWLSMNALNTFIPFLSFLINCIFIPSCFALLLVIGSLLRNEVKEQINKIEHNLKENDEGV